MSSIPPPPPPPPSPPPPPPPPPMSPPPGYVAYGGPGAYGGTFQRIRGLTKTLVILNIIGIVLAAVLLLVQLGVRKKAQEYRNRTISSKKFSDALAPYLGVTALIGLVGLAALVVLIIWTFRMAKNLRALGRPKPSFSPGVTIAINILGGCTLGILPYFMWRELWKGSDPESAPGDPEWKKRPVGQIVHLWFIANLATFLASVGLGVSNAITRVNRGSTASIAKQLDKHLGFIIIAGILGIITSILFVSLVRQLGGRHMQATREA